MEDLQKDFDAVFIGIGAHKPRRLNLPGEELTGVVQGLELLQALNLTQQIDTEESSIWQRSLDEWLPPDRQVKAIIIGGGNTAIDVARSLWRLGADVEVLYRRTRTEMPAIAEDVDELEAEGIPIRFLSNPARILGQDGRVVGIECLRMKLGEPDKDGRRRPVPIADSEFIIETDLVALAIGQLPDLECLGTQVDDFAITRQGTFNVDAVSYMTSCPGTFAGGDAMSGPATVIEAIGEARKAAAAMDDYLHGVPAHELAVSAREIPTARREMTSEEMTIKPRVQTTKRPVSKRERNFLEVEQSYTTQEAVDEANRCLACGPCSECLACESVCGPQAINLDTADSFPHLQSRTIIIADENLPGAPQAVENGAYVLSGESGVDSTTIMARVMADLAPYRLSTLAPALGSPPVVTQPRVGVFVCRCGDEIASVIDIDAVVEKASQYAGVVHVQDLPYSCGPEGRATIEERMASHNLDRALLAACSCCHADQVCYTCTFQRLRTRLNLEALDELSPRLDFVNIREQCAWAHQDDPVQATAKAQRLIAAGVASLTHSVERQRTQTPVDSPVLVIGDNPTAEASLRTLLSSGLRAVHSADKIAGLRGGLGQFVVTLQPHGDKSTRKLTASAIVAAPTSDEGVKNWAKWERDTGVVVCTPGDDPALTGAEASVKIAALLGRGHLQSDLNTAHVDPLRCRACGDCERLCEFDAIHVQTAADGQRYAQVDSVACQGCGLCAAHCPSGALSAGYSTEMQIDAMLQAILS